ncbi:MAG: hypothetical protein OXE43_13120 [Chloroflexi bacterium]|nr:hypothetical protein [Chloroflexota bacterium]
MDAYACLDPPMARSLLFAVELAPVLEDAGAVLTADQAACVREAMAEIDAPAVVAADLPEGDPGPAAALQKAFARCSPACSSMPSSWRWGPMLRVCKGSSEPSFWPT